MNDRARIIITILSTIVVTSAWLLLLREVAITALYSQQAFDYITTFALAVVGGLVVSIFPSVIWEFTDTEQDDAV